VKKLGVLLLIGLGVAVASAAGWRETYVPRTRVYYIAAEDTAWNYAPLGTDPVRGQPLPQPWGTRTVYPKERYVQYFDGSFTTPIPQPAWQGLLGPAIHGVVGDTLKIVFRNNTKRPVSMHSHGVRYAPEDEGAVYQPARGGGDAVPAGGRHTYTWIVRPEAGPLPGEPSSKVWLYHSHAQGDHDIYRGLIGTIVVTSPEHARSNGKPDDVDREFTLLWLVFNENHAHTPASEEESNLKHAINGFVFGNLTGITMQVGERVRWYNVALGTEIDVHTPHWHGDVVKLEGRTYADVIELGPASTKVADMVPDNPGVWLLHCHVADHMMAGMYTTYTIEPHHAVATSEGPAAPAP
jgi:FtsP/CotA-like multicopper oxidase with cupredoxin domain